MNPFVNMNKRGILLPGTCKDLIDVLHQEKQSPILPPPTPTERFVSVGLAQIESFVGMVLRSSHPFARLVVASQTTPVEVGVQRSEQILTLFVKPELGQAAPVKAFFKRRNLCPLVQDWTPFKNPTWTPPTLRYPLVWDEAAAATLIADLFREVYQMPEEAVLEFAFQNLNWPPVPPEF
jgi:hypothetical protein